MNQRRVPFGSMPEFQSKDFNATTQTQTRFPC